MHHAFVFFVCVILSDFLNQLVHGLCFLVARLPDSCLLASHLSGSYLSDPLPPGHLLPSGRRSLGRKQSGRSCCGVVVARSQVSGSLASGSQLHAQDGPSFSALVLSGR